MIRGNTFTTSTKNDQLCDPPTTYPQKGTKDLLFKNNRICKHRTNYTTRFRVDVINIWFLK